MIATSCKDKEKIEQLTQLGCTLIQVPKENECTDLKQLMRRLGEENIDSILLEGGSTLNFSALENGIVSKVQAYISPKILGGVTANSPIGGIGIENPDNAFKLVRKNMKLFGEDIFLEYEVINNVYGDC